jgi:hypothetical protein
MAFRNVGKNLADKTKQISNKLTELKTKTTDFIRSDKGQNLIEKGGAAAGGVTKYFLLPTLALGAAENAGVDPSTILDSTTSIITTLSSVLEEVLKDSPALISIIQNILIGAIELIEFIIAFLKNNLVLFDYLIILIPSTIIIFVIAKLSQIL